MKIRNIAMIGMGAIGSVYGKLLHDTYGDSFFVVAAGERKEKIQSQGISLNGEAYYPSVRDPEDKKIRAQLVLVCVKNYQLDAAIADLKNFVTPATVILPLLNGVTARQRLHEAFPQSHILYGVAMGIDAVRTDHGVENSTNGVIQFGDEKNKLESAVVVTVKERLVEAGIHVEVYRDMLRIVWRKWMLNIGFNQVSALSKSNYGMMASVPETWSAVEAAMREVLQIARKMQIDIGEQDIWEIKKVIPTMNPSGKTSMLQDVEAKRKTEVEYFSGTVIAYGSRLGVAVPVNTTMYELIKGLEANY